MDLIAIIKESSNYNIFMLRICHLNLVTMLVFIFSAGVHLF